jgi:hypothetical protein
MERNCPTTKNKNSPTQSRPLSETGNGLDDNFSPILEARHHHQHQRHKESIFAYDLVSGLHGILATPWRRFPFTLPENKPDGDNTRINNDGKVKDVVQGVLCTYRAKVIVSTATKVDTAHAAGIINLEGRGREDIATGKLRTRQSADPI